MEWLLILLVVVFVLALAGGGSYVYRTYYGPAGTGSTVVESGGPNPLGAVLALAAVLLLLLFLIYGGFNMFHWFGGSSNVNVNVNQPQVQAPSPAASAPASHATP